LNGSDALLEFIRLKEVIEVMGNSKDAIRILARRFVSLSPAVRVQIAAKLLRFEEESRTQQETFRQRVSLTDVPKKSFMEQFWDEVEAAHGDGLYRSNPFSEEEARPFLCAA
jgi:hypothetical protein